MPIIIKDYTWEETDRELFLTIPLKGVRNEKVDILSNENYLKVSFPPYIFECYFYATVLDQSSTARFQNGTLTFTFRKKKDGVWSILHHEKSKDKGIMKEIREKAIEDCRVRQEMKKKAQAEEKQKNDKYALKEQMKLEDQDRSRIEELKENERNQAMEELELWKSHQKDQAKDILSSQKHKKTDKKELFSVDGPRKHGQISVSFSERSFPTAARESTAAAEEEWLKKQAEARRIGVLADEDLTEEERDPSWLLQKGSTFFKNGDMHSAINAFSQGIRMNPNMHSLYSNRALCHLRLGNMMKCLEDSSKALELLNPPVAQNLNSRVKAHVRRGTAFCQLELYAEGLMDYEAALKLVPDNTSLQQDADRIRSIIQGPCPN